MAQVHVDVGDYLHAFKYMLDDRYYQPKEGELVCVQSYKDCDAARTDRVMPVVDSATLQPASYIVDPLELATRSKSEANIRILGVCLGTSDTIQYSLVRENKNHGKPPVDPNVRMYIVGFSGTCPCRVPYSYALNLRPNDPLTLFLNMKTQEHPIQVGTVVFLDTFDNSLSQEEPYYIVQTNFYMPLFSSLVA